MKDLQQTKIEQLVSEHGLPSGICSRCVDRDGVVDSDMLGIAVATAAATKEGMVTENSAEVERLRAELKETEAEAKAVGADRQRLAMRMISLKSQIFRLQGQP